MTVPFPFESKRRSAASDFAIIRAATIAAGFAVGGTAVFSMLIALSHAIQGKNPSLGGTLLRAAPACALLAILGIPASALARRVAFDRFGVWRSLVTHAVLALTFAGTYTLLRAVVDPMVGLPGSPSNLAAGFEYQFVRGFGVAVLVYATIVMATWMVDRRSQPVPSTTDTQPDLNGGADAREVETAAPTTFIVRTGARTYVVPLDHVDWIEAQGNYVALHADGRSHLVRHTMKSLSACLDHTFVRIERSALVRVSAIREVRASGGGHLVILRDGSALKVSRRMREAVISAMAATS